MNRPRAIASPWSLDGLPSTRTPLAAAPATVPAPADRRWRTRQVLLWTAAVALISASFVVSGAAQERMAMQATAEPSALQRTPEQVAAAIRQIADSRSRAADGSMLEDPPLSPRTTPTAWSEVQEIVSRLGGRMRGIERGAESPVDAGLRQALDEATQALDHLRAMEPDPRSALHELSMSLRAIIAVRELLPAGDEDVRFTLDLASDITGAAARIAETGLRRASKAGLKDERLTVAIGDYQQGLTLAEKGHYVEAIEHFGPGVLAGLVPRFDMETFEQNIRAAFQNQSIGFQYSVAQFGQLKATGAAGLARTATDGPVTAQSHTKEMNIASTSKTITATVAMQLLKEKGISIDSSISPYLPDEWAKGPGIGSLTFRQLMTHRSGLNDNGGGPYDYASLQSYIAAGVSLPYKGVFTYQNANFALFRVMIPYIIHGQWMMDVYNALFFFAGKDEIVADLYIDAVRERALDKTNYIEADCQPNDATQTLLYRFPANGVSGVQNGDWTLTCGAGGWYMSTKELVAFMVYRRFSNLIISTDARKQMDDNFLGWMDPDNYSWGEGDWGIYRNHGGDLFYNPSPRRGLDACIIEYPFGVEAAVLINSNGGNYDYQCSEMVDAFDNAFIVP